MRIDGLGTQVEAAVALELRQENSTRKERCQKESEFAPFAHRVSAVFMVHPEPCKLQVVKKTY
jgi:hypothetical protein